MEASFCLSCEKRSLCAKICPELEKTLPKEGSGRLREEHSFDPNILEKIASKRAFEIKYGKTYGEKIDKERHPEGY